MQAITAAAVSPPVPVLYPNGRMHQAICTSDHLTMPQSAAGENSSGDASFSAINAADDVTVLSLITFELLNEVTDPLNTSEKVSTSGCFTLF
jgi:hypothetical protein